MHLNDFLGGMTKAFVFGILVSGIGCLRGLQTKIGASAVGESTTSAVVSGIVLHRRDGWRLRRRILLSWNIMMTERNGP